MNLWHYEDEDEDDREEGSFFWGNGMEKNEGNFLLNIVTYKPQTMDDVQEICDRFLDGDAVILSLEQADGKDEERIVDFLSGAIYSQRYPIIFMRYPQRMWGYLKGKNTIELASERELFFQKI